MVAGFSTSSPNFASVESDVNRHSGGEHGMMSGMGGYDYSQDKDFSKR